MIGRESEQLSFSVPHQVMEVFKSFQKFAETVCRESFGGNLSCGGGQGRRLACGESRGKWASFRNGIHFRWMRVCSLGPCTVLIHAFDD
jgi:hypothetical protein